MSDEEILYYRNAIVAAIKRYVLNCFKYSVDNETVSLGNTGWTVEDIKQYLYMECFYALQRFNPASKTNKRTFVICHMYRRCQQWAAKYCKTKHGYKADITYFSSYEENQ